MGKLIKKDDKEEIRENFTVVSKKMTAYDIILLCIICVAFIISCVAIGMVISIVRKVKGVLSKLKVVSDPKQRERLMRLGQPFVSNPEQRQLLLNRLEKQGKIPNLFGNRKLRQDLGLI